MVDAARCLVALSAAVVLCSGCGGSAHKHTSSRRARVAAVPAFASVALTASAGGAMTCTVYGPGNGTQVIFASRGLDVRADCRAWTRNQAGEGYLWGYQAASAIVGATQLCDVSDRQGAVNASVIQDVGFRPVSAADRARGASACAAMIRAGWRELWNTAVAGEVGTRRG